MRVSYEWLKSMVDVPESPADLVKEIAAAVNAINAFTFDC